MIKIAPSKTHIFQKEEKLCSEKQINNLFTSGCSFIAYPLRVVFYKEAVSTDKSVGLSVLTSVSKKKFKRAVKRNRIKRLTKEAYRLNKAFFTRLCLEHNIHINIAFIYLDDKIHTYETFEKSMLKAANILAEKLNDK